MVDQALHGVIALELTTRVAARVCGDLLAQLGATVFVIQPDGSCTNYERRGPLSIGKRQLSIDLSAASDRALLHDLATASDALIVSSDTSSPLLTAVPIAVHSIDRVVCDITAFGRFGPLAGVSASDAEVQAYTGIIDTTGFTDAPPMPCAVPVVEYMTGTNAAAAVLAALRVRRRLGHGQCVDMALYDSGFLTLSSFLPRILESDTGTAQRTGNRHTLCAPWNAYRARDGWVVICTGSNSQWQRLTELIGQPELGLDRRYLEMSQGRQCWRCGRDRRGMDADADCHCMRGALERGGDTMRPDNRDRRCTTRGQSGAPGHDPGFGAPRIRRRTQTGSPIAASHEPHAGPGRSQRGGLRG